MTIATLNQHPVCLVPRPGPARGTTARWLDDDVADQPDLRPRRA